MSDFYFRTVRLGSIDQLPAASCVGINANEQGYAASGKYWLSINGGAPLQVKYLNWLLTTLYGNTVLNAAQSK